MGVDPALTSNKCDYSDLDNAHADLRVLIRKSCQIGLFEPTRLFNKSFRPQSFVTRSTFESMLITAADLIGYDDTDDIETLMISDKSRISGMTRIEAGHMFYQFAVLANNQ
jgi:hypothetical protein